jgi:hypothetical protein
MTVAIRDWELFDADEGRDLAIEIREYAEGLKNLLRDLKTEDSKAA